MIALIITGCGLSPYITVTFVLLNEISSEKFRAQSSLSLSISWGIGQIVFIIIAYYFTDWQDQMLYFIAIPLVSQLITFLWIYESPKYLIMKKQYKEANSIFQKIAKINKKYIAEFEFQEEHDQMFQQNKVRIYGYLDIFKFKSLRSTTIIMMLTQFTIYLTYYGLIFNLNQLNSDIYKTALLCGGAEIIANIIAFPLLKFRRRIVFPCYTFLAGISSVLFLITDDDYYSMCFAITVKFFISVSFSIMFIYTTELYPIVVKSLGMGLTNFFGKFGIFFTIQGCAIAPIINLVSQNIGVNPMVFYGFLCLIISFLLLKLPESLSEHEQLDIIEIITEQQIIKQYSQQEEQYSQKISSESTDLDVQIQNDNQIKIND